MTGKIATPPAATADVVDALRQHRWHATTTR
jgi:hypothetical protein